MSASECQVLGCLHSNQLCKISSSNLKGWSSNAIANSWAFVLYFHASIVCLSHNFESSQCLSKSTEVQTNDITRSSKQ